MVIHFIKLNTELLIFHCKYNLKKDSILKVDAISRSEGRENAGNGQPTPQNCCINDTCGCFIKGNKDTSQASQEIGL